MGNKMSGIVMLWVMLAVIAAFVQLQGISSTEISRLQILATGPDFTSVHDITGYVSTVVSFGWDWISNVVGMLTFNYPSIFHDEWLLIKYGIFTALGIGFIATIISTWRGGEA